MGLKRTDEFRKDAVRDQSCRWLHLAETGTSDRVSHRTKYAPNTDAQEAYFEALNFHSFSNLIIIQPEK